VWPIEDSIQVTVIDDDDLVRESLGDLLRLEGYHPVACRSGESAWTMLSAGLRPAAIVVDLVLPGMSGREFLSRLRATRWGRRLPVLLLSGWHQLEKVGEAADRVLRKDTEPISVARAVDRLVSGRHSQPPVVVDGTGTT
jgi:CheY-like chemotaxis protein